MAFKVQITVTDTESDFSSSTDFEIPFSDFNKFDKIMDSEFSNIKMNCLSFVYKNYPSIWYNSSPKIEELTSIQLNPLYRITYKHEYV